MREPHDESKPAPDGRVVAVHAALDRETHRLHVLHAPRLHCQRGCSACCVDDLTVFEVEADLIRLHHAELLATGAPHAHGACAFLDAEGGCAAYEHRPYVCRTQGLPLRWIEEHDGSSVELRDICPLNDEGEPIERLAAGDCWTLGPIEEQLARLQVEVASGARRVRLRDLFVSKADPK